MDCTLFVLRAALLCGCACGFWLYELSRRRRHPLSNIPGPRSPSIIRGNMGQFFGFESIAFQLDIINSFTASSVVRLHGMFGRPVLYVYDPKALHTVLIKEEDNFEQSARLINWPCMVSTLGTHHRRQRKLLNPVFTTNRMRSLLPICYKSDSRYATSMVASGPQELDVLSWTTRIALESIGQGAFGHSFDTLADARRSEFGQTVMKLFPAIACLYLWADTFPILDRIPTPIRKFLAYFSPVQAGHELRRLMNDILWHGTKMFEEKKRALGDGNSGVVEQMARGNDFMSLLMKANMAASEADSLPEAEVIAQTAVLIVTATDTTSNTLGRILQLLAENPDVQHRLREEAIEAWQDGHVAYGRLMQLPYIDAVFRETMRLHSPATWVIRDVRRDTVLPLSTPIVGIDGTVMDEIPVPKGCEVIIGLLGANTNKAIWGEDALQWKPERWLNPLPPTVARNTFPGVSPNLMSFSGGRRACIGWKFAEMEIKAMLSILLPRFVFSPGSREIVWRAAHAVFPTVGDDAMTPQLPLTVSLYHAAPPN
ncbi:cytochrome P450 [Fomitopsis serialis]|uniref:cytochrome P450 n=1 Tax=Fomitopsis serialis TaxID=139415 RepID=UPI0020084210|nr:cytochrome P450 [Neoantrodia serialis]KAH9923622.1 cytochrome P450 [Neoantrodia serialis]